jgi:tetratricopeptide (TPR) repeat protein
LVIIEAARPREYPEAVDYILQGRAAVAKGPVRDSLADAVGLFERALSLDPGSVLAQGQLANALMTRVLENMTDTRAADIDRAQGLVGQALAASPKDRLAHFAKGKLLRVQGRCEEAIVEFETVLAIDRNSVGALMQTGRCRMSLGLLEQAIPPTLQAIRLSPDDPYVGVWYGQIGQAHLLQSRTEEAILWLERSRSALSDRSTVHMLLAAAYGLKGDTGRAAAELADARRLAADNRYSTIAHLRAEGSWSAPNVRAAVESTYFDGLRRAGMAEE